MSNLKQLTADMLGGLIRLMTLGGIVSDVREAIKVAVSDTEFAKADAVLTTIEQQYGAKLRTPGPVVAKHLADQLTELFASLSVMLDDKESRRRMVAYANEHGIPHNIPPVELTGGVDA
jgi:hypothetical protein